MRSSAALFVGVLLVVSVAGVGAGHVGDDAAPSDSALPRPSGVDVPTDLPAESATGPAISTTHDSGPPVAGVSTAAFGTGNAADASANATQEGTNATQEGTRMYVAIDENGHARWNVSARFVLDDANETAAFRQLAREYENGTTDVGFTRRTFEPALERAGTDTDRPMHLRNVDRSSTFRENGSVGVLSLSFTWTNFTGVEGNRLALGDVFWVGSETWLPALTADQSLIIEGPPGYYIVSSNVAHSGLRIHFEGPRTFEPGDFSVAYAPKQTVTTTTATTTTTTTDGFPDLSGTSLLVVLVVFGVGFGAYAAAQRRDPDPDVAESADAADAGSGPAPPADGDAGGTDGEPDDEGEDDGPPAELLSDEERVLRLLRDNDGRMKQSDIVKETNWSNAKVSQLLSKMNDNDEVNKLRIGRENLITLPDEDVTDLD